MPPAATREMTSYRPSMVDSMTDNVLLPCAGEGRPPRHSRAPLPVSPRSLPDASTPERPEDHGARRAAGAGDRVGGLGPQRVDERAREQERERERPEDRPVERREHAAPDGVRGASLENAEGGHVHDAVA